MIYRNFQGKELSMLGFGTMRLPTLPDGAIDEKQVFRMVDLAMSHGVNYFDTAWPYHGGLSEVVIGKALVRYPREKWYLANKYPGHQIASSYDPKAIFEEQLQKCGVEYFDFYLLHNVYEKSIETYLDPRWGILDYFKEQKRLGRIKHLGFSTHGRVELIKEFLEACGEDMEFCQIQLNYLDWTLQDAKAKVNLLNEWKIPIWVMEPLRGGKLCQLKEEEEKALRALRPDEGAPAWGLRFLQGIEGVSVVLSGMSNRYQMQENIRTFAEEKPLSHEEQEALLALAEGMKDSVPCTGCRYCTAHCPKGLDIPMLLETYNDVRYLANVYATMRVEALPEEKQPAACIACGKCARMCPQNIDIPAAMKDFAEKFAQIPTWVSICKEREEAAKKLKK
ncbi:MAG: 4Fe-4S dicluster domain-containing protein [Clostridiales bacterium]|nr:4Fe-4S dicluster domain-containing protein [Clostridiales bacterium]